MGLRRGCSKVMSFRACRLLDLIHQDGLSEDLAAHPLALYIRENKGGMIEMRKANKGRSKKVSGGFEKVLLYARNSISAITKTAENS